MGQTHSRRPSTQNNAVSAATPAAPGRVDGAPSGRAATPEKPETRAKARDAPSRSAKPTHLRNKSSATDKDSHKWRKRLSSTFGKRRRSSKMGKDAIVGGADDVDEHGVADGAAEAAPDVLPLDDARGADAERRRSAVAPPEADAFAGPSTPAPAPSSPVAVAPPAPGAAEASAPAETVPTSPPSDPTPHDDPQPSSTSSPANATGPTSPRVPPTGVLLVQGIVQTHDIRVDSDSPSPEDRSPSPAPEGGSDSAAQAAEPLAADTAASAPASPLEAASAAQQQGATVEARRRSASELFSALRRASAERVTGGGSSDEYAPALEAARDAPGGSAEPVVESHDHAPLPSEATGTSADTAAPNNASQRPARTDSPLPNHTIDVLSTYLSLAAAATAASLLTGSADPIVNSGLVGRGEGEGAASSGSAPATTDSTPESRPPTVPAPYRAAARQTPVPTPPVSEVPPSVAATPATLPSAAPAMSSPTTPVTASPPTAVPPAGVRRPGRRYQGSRARSAYDRFGLTSSARRGGRREAEDEPTGSGALPGVDGQVGTVDEEEVEEVTGWRNAGTSSTVGDVSAPPAGEASATNAYEPQTAQAVASTQTDESPTAAESIAEPSSEPPTAPSGFPPPPPPPPLPPAYRAPELFAQRRRAFYARALEESMTSPRRDITGEIRYNEERELERNRAQVRERQGWNGDSRRALLAAMGTPRAPSSSPPPAAVSSLPSATASSDTAAAITRPASTGTQTTHPAPSAGLAELARALRNRLGIRQDGEHAHGEEQDPQHPHTHNHDDDIWSTFSEADDDDDDLFGNANDASADASMSPTSFESFLRDLRTELRNALGGGVTAAEENAEEEVSTPDADFASNSSPTPPSTAEADGDSDDEMPQLEAVEAAAAQRPQRAAPVPGVAPAAAGLPARSERDRLLDVLAGIGSLLGGAEGGARRNRHRASAASARRSRSVPRVPMAPPPTGPQRLGALAGVRSSGGRRASPDGGVNWWSMYRFAPVVVSPVHPANINVNPTAATGAPTTPPASSGSGPPSAIPSSPTNSTGSRSPLADTHIVFPVIIVGIQSIENIFGIGAEHATTPSPAAATTDRQVQEDETTPLLDAQEEHEEGQSDADQPLAEDASRAPWRSRAADAVRRTIRRARGTTTEDGAAQTDGGDGVATTEAPSSRTFAMYVIGAYYPPTHALLTSPPPPTFDALLELADLSNLGNLGAIGLAMGGLGSRAATVSKEQIGKSNLIVVKAKDLVVWTPAEGEKEPEREVKDTAVRDNCIERCLICLEGYEAEDDVRVMSCRHAFHKSCVDTWMETGKNNCPFCRGKGVDTTEQPAAAAATAV